MKWPGYLFHCGGNKDLLWQHCSLSSSKEDSSLSVVSCRFIDPPLFLLRPYVDGLGWVLISFCICLSSFFSDLTLFAVFLSFFSAFSWFFFQNFHIFFWENIFYNFLGGGVYRFIFCLDFTTVVILFTFKEFITYFKYRLFRSKRCESFRRNGSNRWDSSLNLFGAWSRLKSWGISCRSCFRFNDNL